MVEYLKNSICKLKPLWNYNESKTFDIISVCFFKMENKYKNFDVYIDGLKWWIKYLNDTKTNYFLRLFIDSNIYNDNQLMDLITSCDKIQPVLFECINYIENGYHFGTFGTLVRYFPFFNFPNNDANNVIIAELDMYYDTIDKLNLVMENDMENKICVNGRNQFFMDGKNEIMIPYILGGLMYMGNIKHDYNIIINFILNAPNINDLGMYDKRNNPFDYGTDELFLNKYFMNNLNEINFFYNYSPIYFIKYFYEQYSKKIDRTNLVFKYMMGKYYNNQSNDKVIKIILYFKSKDFNKYKYVCLRFYKIINYFVISNKKWLDPTIMKIIIKYFNNIITSIAILSYNMTNKQLLSVKNYYEN